MTKPQLRVDNSKSMLTQSGELEIAIKCKDVTWFNFLQASRLAKSPNGGWDNRTYWQVRGLNNLNHNGAAFLSKWTENSLKPKCHPTPRTSDFMFDRPLSNERNFLVKKGPLKKMNTLTSLSENEINARLFHDNTHSLWGKSIGYEIPLAEESDGQLKVDIVAIGRDNSSLEFIELKKADNASNSPLMALTEAICYGIQAIRCQKSLLGDKVLLKNHVSLGHFNKIRLILAAPQNYWTIWNWDASKMVEPMKNIVSQVNTALPSETRLIFDKSSILCIENGLL